MKKGEGLSRREKKQLGRNRDELIKQVSHNMVEGFQADAMGGRKGEIFKRFAEIDGQARMAEIDRITKILDIDKK